MSTFFETLLQESVRLLEPVSAAAEDQRAREQLFDALDADLEGVDLDALDARFGNLATAYQSLQDLVPEDGGGDDGGSFEDIQTGLEATASLFAGIQGIDEDLQGVSVSNVGEQLIEYLFARYLYSYRPKVLHALVGLTVVDFADPPEDVPAHRHPVYPLELPPGATVEFGRFADLLEDPIGTLATKYALDGVTDSAAIDALATQFFAFIGPLFGQLGFYYSVGQNSREVQNFHGASGVTLASRSLTVYREIADGVSVGVRIALADTPDGLGLVVYPQGTASLEQAVDDWSVSVSLGAGFDVIVVNSTGIAQAEPQSGELEGSVDVQKSPDSGGDAAVLGATDGTRLELGTLGVGSDWTLSSDTTAFGVEATAGDSSLVVTTANADSFLKKMLPEDGVTVDFDAGIGYHTERGLYFNGGAGLETEIPVNLNIADVLAVDTLQLGAKPDFEADPVTIPVHIAADPQVSLGPIDAVVEGIGLEAELSFPEDNTGNLGPVAVDLGFKPPTGAGMSVDAGVVTGGGYLSFDHENERYAGVLQLKIGELTITAIGLLTTQLPNGRDGFSLLLIISGEFPAMQLGFGFTLDGLGGLLGINRSMDVEFLMAGVNDGTVRSIMFPEDPVRNAPQIISNVRNGFPVAPGNHVFGPMGKLGWGTPSIVSASIGVLFDMPDPIRIAILGRVHVGLPHEEIGIVVLNMDVFGAVDFGEQIAGAAATLYDSRIMVYSLSGDMAMKTGWGDDPTFVLSVGGFNPRFDPPADFPELRRLALSIGPGNPRVRLEAYLAMTANTLQVGARAEIYAAAAGFSFEGKIGFDTLFKFEPFELIADVYAGFALKRGGSQLMSVKVDGTLTGPGPWHVKGKASFEIWPVNFDIKISKKFGQSESADEIPPADVFGKVTKALEDERNWSAQRPAGGDSVVTLRQIETEGEQVLAHPLGEFSVRQKVSPLGVRIEKYSGGSPATYDRFEIVDVTVGNDDEDADSATREQFARAEYFELSDDEKVAGPEFEQYQAGTQISNTGFAWGGMGGDDGLTASDELDYETAVIDEKAAIGPIYVGQIAMPASTATNLAAVSAVARGPLRTTGNVRFQIDEEETGPTGVDDSVSVSDASFVVARTTDLTRVEIDAIPAGGTTKREAEEALTAYVNAHDAAEDDYQIVGAHEVADGEGDA